MTDHVEVPVKVNAWVDEGVAPLVQALNEFGDLETMDSCEATPEGAYVLFRHRGSNEEAAAFAAEMGAALASSGPECLLQAEWRPGSDEPLLALSCPRDLVSALADALSGVRRTSSADGTTCRGRGS